MLLLNVEDFLQKWKGELILRMIGRPRPLIVYGGLNWPHLER